MAAGHMSYNYALEGRDTKQLFDIIFNNTKNSSVIVTDLQDEEKDMSLCIFLELQGRENGYIYDTEARNFVGGYNEDEGLRDFSAVDVYITRPKVENSCMKNSDEILKWKLYNIHDRYLIYVK